jgi:DNA-binding NtrC family response regulator
MNISLVLLDLTMPHLSGEEVLYQIRETRPNLPVLLSSGYNAQALTYDILNDPFTDFTQKPHGFDVLIDKIQTLLKRAEVPPQQLENKLEHYF